MTDYAEPELPDAVEHEALVSPTLSTSTQRTTPAPGQDEGGVIFSDRDLGRIPYYRPARYWKNLICLSVAVVLIISAFYALANLQSTLNQSAGLGVASLCVIYVGMLMSSLLTPAIIKLLQVKVTLVVCSVFYSLYVASNIYPIAPLMIPPAFLLGLAATAFWASIGTYITTSGIQLAHVTNTLPEVTINRFNGVFFCIYQTSQVWGNLLSSVMLRDDVTPSSPASRGQCGRHSCGATMDVNVTDVESKGSATTSSRKQTLYLIFINLSFCIIATLMLIFLLDKLPAAPDKKRKTWRKELTKYIGSTLQLMTSPTLALLIPLTVCSGMTKAFMSADFTKAFVSCTQGAGAVGYAMVGFGAAASVASVIFGQLEKHVGRVAIFMFGVVLHMALFSVMDWWSPESSATWQLVLMAVGAGIADAVWCTQFSSIYGVLFPGKQEAAFTNYRLWESIGYVLSYAFTIPAFICVRHKLYGLLGLLFVSMATYLLDEYLISRKVRLAKTKESESEKQVD